MTVLTSLLFKILLYFRPDALLYFEHLNASLIICSCVLHYSLCVCFPALASNRLFIPISKYCNKLLEFNVDN
jgi:hypothetical protein